MVLSRLNQGGAWVWVEVGEAGTVATVLKERKDEEPACCIDR